jgi:hypothetical protein
VPTTPAAEPEPETGVIGAIESAETAPETAPETDRRRSGPAAARRPRRQENPSAEAVMWAHFQTQRKAGHTPSGAELDRVAGTNNYGRDGRLPYEWRVDRPGAGKLGGALDVLVMDASWTTVEPSQSCLPPATTPRFP